MAEESDAPTRTDCSTTPTDALDSSEREQRDATQKAAERLVDVEWLLHRERRGEPLRPLPLRADARGWHGAARVLFKLRYAQDDPVTRWFATTRLADYESRRRQAQLDGGSGGSVGGGCSPVWTVRVAAAVLAALLLLTFAGTIAFSAFALGGCGAGTGGDAVTACGTTTPTTERVCTRFDEFWVWTNCSAVCLPTGYPTKQEESEQASGDGCKRVRWQSCYGPTACWTSPTQRDEPIDQLKCAQSTMRFHRLHKYDLDVYECPAADTTYCHVFADGTYHKLYYGCFDDKFKLANSDLGCGKTIPNGECRFVTTNMTKDRVHLEGQLCCCYGDACNNKTLAQLAVNKTKAVSTCVASVQGGDKRHQAEFTGPGSQDNCTPGSDICFDWAGTPNALYDHRRGCELPPKFKHIHDECIKQLGRRERTCFDTTIKQTNSNNTDPYGVCCCSGDNCTADNALAYLYKCDYEYALVDGAPDDDGGGGGGAQVVDGCEAVLARVPAAAAACARFGDGCFVARDVDDKSVSLCCCLGAACVPDDVRVYVANEAPTPPPTTSSEATSTASGGETEATTGDCGWAVWTAAVCAALSLLLLVAVAPAAYVAYELSDVKEAQRWVKLFLQVKQPAVDWPSDFRKHMLFCVQEASDALAKHQ